MELALVRFQTNGVEPSLHFRLCDKCKPACNTDTGIENCIELNENGFLGRSSTELLTEDWSLRNSLELFFKYMYIYYLCIHINL